MSNIPVSVQLYTVRSLAEKDFAATAKEVARIGFKWVELAGYGNLKTAAEVKKVLDDNGLKVSGAHIGQWQMENEAEKQLDDAQLLGNKNIVIPWMDESKRKSADGWKKIAAELTAIGRKCAARGMQLSYHNHAFEYEVFDGRTGMDILWSESDPNLVKSELDCYWVAYAGVDPAEYTRKLGKRITILHIKDMAAGPDRKFAPYGQGVIDYKSVIAEGAKIGCQFIVVEQDNTYDTPPMEAVRTSYRNLQQQGLA